MNKYFSKEAGKMVDESYTSGGATGDQLEIKNYCNHKFGKPDKVKKNGDPIIGAMYGDFEVVAINPEVSCFCIYKCKKCGYLMSG